MIDTIVVCAPGRAYHGSTKRGVAELYYKAKSALNPVRVEV